MCLAIPAKIVEFSAEEQTCALVEVGGVRRIVDLSLLQDDPPAAGEWVIVHVGFALSKLSEEEALEQIRILSILGDEEDGESAPAP